MAAKVPAPGDRAPGSRALDDLIMGTNSSSIVSKRSVERLYYPNEPHYFRFFVRKFQRRAPLINRGYWLRLRAIDVIVRQFLTQPTTHRRIVINLGCGSDVLPWQCHVRYGDFCKNTVFVDVDYPDLIRKKREVVLGTPQLRELLGDNIVLSVLDDEPVLLRSDSYCQLACDLRQLDVLQQALESIADLSTCSILFVAEVSITYMDTTSANALLRWAGSVGRGSRLLLALLAQFCLLEQILPEGPDHPFAATMLKHFEKLKAPPRSVARYQSLASQRTRFLNRGWCHADVFDLWDTWNSDRFLSSTERIALEKVEPFDEWEEFVLFARHYCVVHARSYSQDSPHESRSLNRLGSSQSRGNVRVINNSSTTTHPRRRFGNTMTLRGPLGQAFAVHLMGMGISGRTDTHDIWALGDGSDLPRLPTNGPPPRVCCTITDLGEYGVLLAGGRSSPSNSFSDCWLFDKGAGEWRSTWSLPRPLYRHSAVCLKGASLALVIGGKNDSTEISKDCYLFNPCRGWTRCEVLGDVPEPAFGSILCNMQEVWEPGRFQGILAGGLDRSGLFVTANYFWRLDLKGSQPQVHFCRLNIVAEQSRTLALFGAQVVEFGGRAFVCGGVGQEASYLGQTVTLISLAGGSCQSTMLRPSESDSSPMPFMIGCSVVSQGNSLVVMGGGATCFSMGTYWQPQVTTIDVSLNTDSASAKGLAHLVQTIKVVYSPADSRLVQSIKAKGDPTAVPRMRIMSGQGFEKILRERQPVILEHLDLGDCVARWRPAYMADHVGRDKEVVVHECRDDSERMDFNSKNFRYVTDKFGSMVERMHAGHRLYLRSLSGTQPTEAPASLEHDFPELAADFRLPPELSYVKEHQFSSVLRMSGKVNMWLHYDVMANVYVQISGSKSIILFPPTDVTKLSFAPGASSSSLDVFSALGTPSLVNTHPYVALLHPGDVLFLPPMWLHTATPLSDMNVAVNVFFRDLESGYAKGRDVYGNRDLGAYEKGRQDVEKIGKSFQSFPADIRLFYLNRLADEMLQVASQGGQ